MKLLAGPASQEIGRKIAELLNLDQLKLQFKYFFDHETYLRIEGDINKEEIILVQNTFYPQEKHLVEAFLLSKTLKEMGAGKIIAVIPYLCYARADRRRIEGEVISHKIVLELLQNVGVDSVITVNVHNTAAFTKFASEIEKYDLNAFEFLAKQIKSPYNKEWLVVGPDKGAAKNARLVAQVLETNYYWLEKYRDPETHEVKFEEPDFNCNGEDVLIVDDIVSSGGTVIKAAQMLKNLGAKSVSFLVVHSVATKETIAKMKQEGIEKIFVSSTIPPAEEKEVEVIDISPLLAQFIKEKFL